MDKNQHDEPDPDLFPLQIFMEPIDINFDYNVIINTVGADLLKDKVFTNNIIMFPIETKFKKT